MKRMTDFFKSHGDKRCRIEESTGNANESTESDSLVVVSTEMASTCISSTSQSVVAQPTCSKSKSYEKKFQHQWLKNTRYANWLKYDKEKQVMTCEFCIKTHRKNPMAAGCNNFRTSTLDRHLVSEDHRFAVQAIVSQGTMRKEIEKEIDAKEMGIISAMRAIHWLASEKIATHKYESLLNFLEIQGCDDIKVLNCGKSVKYSSHTTAEELQDAMSDVIKSQHIEILQNCNFISIICDESTDVSVTKKLVLMCRYLKVAEDTSSVATMFLDNVDVRDGQASTIHDAIQACLVANNIDDQKVMFLGSDGAAVMTGKKSGVSARMKANQKFLINIHCVAHRLALCTSYAANNVDYLKKYRETLTSIYYHFKHSAVRTNLLKEIGEVLQDEKILRIKEIHAVRWFAFFSALRAIFHTWSALVAYFEQQKRAESGGAMKGLYNTVTQFQFVATTYFLMDVIPVVTQLSLFFQKETLDISMVEPMIISTTSQLEHLKKEDGHNVKALWEFMDTNNNNVLHIRGHDIPVTEIQKKNFENIRNQFIDGLIKEIRNRFPESDTSVVGSFSVLGLKGLSFVQEGELENHGCDKIDQLLEFYAPDSAEGGSVEAVIVNAAATRLEWSLLKTTVRSNKYPTGHLNDLWAIIRQYHHAEFPNLLKLAELALIAPIQTADCERAFSVQNDLKTAMRSRLSQDRLSVLMRIVMEKVPVGKFNYSAALGVWKNKKKRRLYQSHQSESESL